MNILEIKQELFKLLGTHPEFRIGVVDIGALFDKINELPSQEYAALILEAAGAEIANVPVAHFLDTAHKDIGGIVMVGIGRYFKETPARDWNADFLSLVLEADCASTPTVSLAFNASFGQKDITIAELNEFLRKTAGDYSRLSAATCYFLLRVFSPGCPILHAFKSNYDQADIKNQINKDRILDEKERLCTLFGGMLRQAKNGVFLSDFTMEPAS